VKMPFGKDVGEDLEAVARLGRAPATQCEPPGPVVVWDPQAAILTAFHAAGPPGCRARQTLTAGLALRLAEQGHVTEVSFTVADGTSLEAIRCALAELVPGAATSADAHRRPYEAAGDERARLDSAPRDGAAHASRKRSGALVKRARACLICGAVFTVNFRQADVHRFCSAACRSRHRRLTSRNPVPKATTSAAEHPGGQ